MRSSASRLRSWATRAAVILGLAVLTAGCGASIGSAAGDVEASHGVVVPDSGDDFETVGDTGLAARAGLDRGYTSVFTMDEADLDDFLASLPEGESDSYSNFFGPPSNRQYQPSTTPWESSAAPLFSVTKDSPAGGDFLSVQVFPVSEGRVGLLLYSDWN